MIKPLLLCIVFFMTTVSANVLQESIDRAPEGAILRLSAGTYLGNIKIDRALSIIAKEPGVIIQGDHQGSVVTITGSDVTLKGLTITGSGERMDRLDAAITINKSHRCAVRDCQLLDSLYGIDMAMVDDSVITGNFITSKENSISLRGDALKIWYSHGNLIKANIIEASRDVTLTHSNDNMIEENEITRSRYGVYMEHCRGNTVQENRLSHNSVGVMLMGAKKTVIAHNTIESSHGAAGIGVALKGVSDLLFKDNLVRYNAKGLFIDTKFTEKHMQRVITDNEISYNGEALHFHAAIQNNTITHNRFVGNIDDVVKSSKNSVTSLNVIEYNQWDRYAGFDTDHDNIGDTPHQVLQYADRLWQYDNKVKFFYASPIMTLLDFLASIAPFIEPVLIIEDAKPIVKE